MSWEIIYYSTQIKRNIGKFPKDVSDKTNRIIELLEEFGPVEIKGQTKIWEKDIWEITANEKSGWGRVMYIAIAGNKIYMLYSFLKKTNTTPNEIAKEVRRRAKEVKKYE